MNYLAANEWAREEIGDQVRCLIGILETSVAAFRAQPDVRTVRWTVFGFIIAYLGRPRRIIAHEDSTRAKFTIGHGAIHPRKRTIVPK